MMSFGPPGGNGTISLIGLVGKSCAGANAGNNSADNPIASALRIFMEASRMDSSSWRGGAVAPSRILKSPLYQLRDTAKGPFPRVRPQRDLPVRHLSAGSWPRG